MGSLGRHEKNILAISRQLLTGRLRDGGGFAGSGSVGCFVKLCGSYGSGGRCEKNNEIMQKCPGGSGKRRGGKKIECMPEYLPKDYSTCVLFWQMG